MDIKKMTNREKIEQFLQNNPDINEWYWVCTYHNWITEEDDNLFIYHIGFVDNGDNLDGVYNCSVNEDDTIYYIRHIQAGL
jgi:hypothetical protein